MPQIRVLLALKKKANPREGARFLSHVSVANVRHVDEDGDGDDVGDHLCVLSFIGHYEKRGQA